MPAQSRRCARMPFTAAREACKSQSGGVHLKSPSKVVRSCRSLNMIVIGRWVQVRPNGGRSFSRVKKYLAHVEFRR